MSSMDCPCPLSTANIFFDLWPEWLSQCGGEPQEYNIMHRLALSTVHRSHRREKTRSHAHTISLTLPLSLSAVLRLQLSSLAGVFWWYNCHGHWGERDWWVRDRMRDGEGERGTSRADTLSMLMPKHTPSPPVFLFVTLFITHTHTHTGAVTSLHSTFSPGSQNSKYTSPTGERERERKQQ